MNKPFELTVHEILDKQFNVDFKGYNAREVDEFLDAVINDYQVYDEKLKECSETLLRYEDTIERLKNQIADLELQCARKEEKTSNATNVDILKRISRLEAEVFKNNALTLGQSLAQARGKSMLAHSAMNVVFMLGQSINLGREI